MIQKNRLLKWSCLGHKALSKETTKTRLITTTYYQPYYNEGQTVIQASQAQIYLITQGDPHMNLPTPPALLLGVPWATGGGARLLQGVQNTNFTWTSLHLP